MAKDSSSTKRAELLSDLIKQRGFKQRGYCCGEIMIAGEESKFLREAVGIPDVILRSEFVKPAVCRDPEVVFDEQWIYDLGMGRVMVYVFKNKIALVIKEWSDL